MPVLLAEPADHLGVERLAGRARVAQLGQRELLAGVLDRRHRPQRRGRGEQPLHAVLGEEAQLLLGVEAALAREYERGRAVAPGSEQRRDPGRPGPLAHAVEQLAVLHVVAELELLVGEEVAVGVQDALGQAGGAGGVVELGRVVGGGVGDLVGVRGRLHRLEQVDVAVLALAAVRVLDHEHLLDHAVGDAVAVGRVGDQRLGARVAQPVLDALVAVEHRHRQQDRAALVGAEEHGGGLGQRRQQRGHAILALDAVGLERAREAVRQVLQLAEAPRGARVPRKSSHTIASLSRGCLSHTSWAML